MAKGLTKNITLKQARAYNQTVPNGRGVTSIAQVNGSRGRSRHRRGFDYGGGPDLYARSRGLGPDEGFPADEFYAPFMRSSKRGEDLNAPDVSAAFHDMSGWKEARQATQARRKVKQSVPSYARNGHRRFHPNARMPMSGPHDFNYAVDDYYADYPGSGGGYSAPPMPSGPAPAGPQYGPVQPSWAQNFYASMGIGSRRANHQAEMGPRDTFMPSRRGQKEATRQWVDDFYQSMGFKTKRDDGGGYNFPPGGFTPNGVSEDEMQANGRRYGKKGRKSYGRKSGKGRGSYNSATTRPWQSFAGHKALSFGAGKGSGNSFRTYVYKNKSGRLRKIPEFALMGFKSDKAMQSFIAATKDDPTYAKVHENLRKRGLAIRDARASYAKETAEYGNPLTPNRKHRRKAAKRSKSRKHGKGKRKFSKSAIAAWMKNLKKARSAKGKKRGRKSSGRMAAKRGKHSKSRKSYSKKVRRSYGKGKRKFAKAYGKGKRRGSKHRKSGKGKRRSYKKYSKHSRSAKRYTRNGSELTPNRRRKHGKGKRRGYGKGKYRKYGKGKRRGYGKKSAFRAKFGSKSSFSFRKNKRFTRNGFMNDFISVLKVGAIVAGGFIAHRAITGLLAPQLTKLSPSLAGYESLISGLAVAAVGVLAASKMLSGSTAMQVSSGMAVSFLHGAIVTVLQKMNQPAAATAIAGLGEYRQMNGLGAYYQQSTGGFGSFSGGQYGARQLPGGIHQALAGRTMQASAGYSTAMEAAAGTGAYYAQNVQGIGDYEAVPGRPLHGDYFTDDGILGGDLGAAERALDMMEAAAGFGGDTDASSDVNPGDQYDISNPSDAETGLDDDESSLRTGLFKGASGIFGI